VKYDLKKIYARLEAVSQIAIQLIVLTLGERGNACVIKGCRDNIPFKKNKRYHCLELRLA